MARKTGISTAVSRLSWREAESINNCYRPLVLSMRVALNQKILIRNPDTLEEHFVRVVHVTPAPEGKSEVGVEFLKPAPKFWRISFPPDDWTPTTPNSPPTPSNATPRPA